MAASDPAARGVIEQRLISLLPVFMLLQEQVKADFDPAKFGSVFSILDSSQVATLTATRLFL